MKTKPFLIAGFLGLILSVLAILCASAPVRLLAALAEAVADDEQAAWVLKTLSMALVQYNWLLIAPGTLLMGLPVYRFCVTRRIWLKLLSIIGMLFFFIVIIIASMLTMHVNKFPVYTVIRILIQLAMGGA
ncbi:MAG: hypothetical protein IJE08_01260 [Clostridia bacterium]|nr:hypothetical protein [Clostridia bacterium]